MRHARRNQRLSLPSEHRQALLNGLVKSLVAHGQIRTTYARAKEAQRLADRLVTLGKEGSLHSRRRAFRILQDRTLVKRLFAEIAPRYVDISGGYARVLRLSVRPGDGAQEALLALSRLPALQPATPTPSKPGGEPQPGPTPAPAQPQKQKTEESKEPKGFFQGLRDRWARKRKGGGPS